jgi:hypothetical protein
MTHPLLASIVVPDGVRSQHHNGDVSHPVHLDPRSNDRTLDTFGSRFSRRASGEDAHPVRRDSTVLIETLAVGLLVGLLLGVLGGGGEVLTVPILV